MVPLNVIIRTVSRIAMPLAIAVAFILLFQGHNRPGGGFIAAVLTVLAITLVYLAFDPTFLEEWIFPEGGPSIAGRLKSGVLQDHRRYQVAGLVLAAMVSGLGAMLLGRAFLTQAHWEVHLPLLGAYEVTTSLVFDVGVYLVVVGSLLTMVEVIARS